MRIVVDLTSLSYHLSGIERYALCITKELLKLDSNDSFILVFRDSIYPDFESFIETGKVEPLVLHGNKKFVFFNYVLPYHLYKLKANKYLFLAFSSPILFWKKGIINTIHDMGPWECSNSLNWKQIIYYRINGFISAKVAQKIITVSNFSKDKICKYFKVSEEKVKVAYSAVSDSLQSRSSKEFSKIAKDYCIGRKPYIMTLSTIEPRKNMELLLRAYNSVANQLDYDLVLIGRKGWMMDEVLSKYENLDRIHITGFVEDEDVVEIYRNALCFVFPSLYEGFGLPPIEALSVGTPVISSDAASLPEILRKQAIYFRNNDVYDLTEKLKSLRLNLKNMCSELDEFQKINYSFSVSARKILDIIRS